MTDDGLLAAYMFDLPQERIAQRPSEQRDKCRLLELLPNGSLRDGVFSDLASLLQPGDIVIRNNVRVIPARLRGKRSGGGAAELLLIRRDPDSTEEVWFCMARPANKFKPGRCFHFGPQGQMPAEVLGRDAEGFVRVRFPVSGSEFDALLAVAGETPLPPYIQRPEEGPDAFDLERYQTVYAREPGACAAPTAGLHFTERTDAELRERGIEIAELTLHVGPGTFRPVTTDRLDEHKMHAEWYEIPQQTMEAAHEARARGGRIIAVGTTTVRALEAAHTTGVTRGQTDIFIRPGYEFGMVDALVTNFHLPGSTLLVLVSALAGLENVLSAYRHAIRNGYMFYSYGDAMLIWQNNKLRTGI